TAQASACASCASTPRPWTASATTWRRARVPRRSTPSRLPDRPESGSIRTLLREVFSVPLLDRYLEAMQKQRAEALVFKTGANVSVLISGVTKLVSNKAATSDQIQALLAEVLGANFH